MAKQIEEVVQKCAVCNKHKNNDPREPLTPHPVPLRAWSKVGIDLFHFNNAEYIMCVDYYSKYPEISKLSGTTSKHIITALKSVFARHGVPDELFSDNGRQLISAEMQDFATRWEFKHSTSSPEFPQSNGQAERAIQTVKNPLKKVQESLKDPHRSFGVQKHAIGRSRLLSCAAAYGKEAEDKTTCVKEPVKARSVHTCTEQIDEQTKEAETLL